MEIEITEEKADIKNHNSGFEGDPSVEESFREELFLVSHKKYFTFLYKKEEIKVNKETAWFYDNILLFWRGFFSKGTPAWGLGVCWFH